MSGNSVHVHTKTVTSDNTGKVSFSGIPSGHDYILKETKAPDGYQLNEAEYKVTVAYDKVDWKNKPADSKVVNKPLEPVVYLKDGVGYEETDV